MAIGENCVHGVRPTQSDHYPGEDTGIPVIVNAQRGIFGWGIKLTAVYYYIGTAAWEYKDEQKRADDLPNVICKADGLVAHSRSPVFCGVNELRRCKWFRPVSSQ